MYMYNPPAYHTVQAPNDVSPSTLATCARCKCLIHSFHWLPGTSIKSNLNLSLSSLIGLIMMLSPREARAFMQTVPSTQKAICVYADIYVHCLFLFELQLSCHRLSC